MKSQPSRTHMTCWLLGARQRSASSGCGWSWPQTVHRAPNLAGSSLPCSASADSVTGSMWQNFQKNFQPATRPAQQAPRQAGSHAAAPCSSGHARRSGRRTGRWRPSTLPMHRAACCEGSAKGIAQVALRRGELSCVYGSRNPYSTGETLE
jgi:hypothetical protein